MRSPTNIPSCFRFFEAEKREFYISRRLTIQLEVEKMSKSEFRGDRDAGRKESSGRVHRKTMGNTRPCEEWEQPIGPRIQPEEKLRATIAAWSLNKR